MAYIFYFKKSLSDTLAVINFKWNITSRAVKLAIKNIIKKKHNASDSENASHSEGNITLGIRTG